ncbi:MAG: Rieske (2Fe-2S) protein [Candidatus Heimdallarchaeota archaeon]
MPLHKICSVADLPVDSAKEINIEKLIIAVFNHNGKYYAINKKCTHLGGNLAKGKVENKTVKCPLHGTVFNLETGEVVTHPGGLSGWFKKSKITTTYKIKKKGEDLFIELPEVTDE